MVGAVKHEVAWVRRKYFRSYSRDRKRRTHANYEYDLRNKFSLHSDLPCLITGSSVVRIAQEEMPQQPDSFLHLSAN